MGAQGTATLDFGAFPGSNVASVTASAPGVVSGSAIEAWIRPVATADHTDVDHVAAAMKVVAAFEANDVIRIYGINTNDVIPPEEDQPQESKSWPTGTRMFKRRDRAPAPMLVGQFNVWWVWN